MNLDAGIYNHLAGDFDLTSMLNLYKDHPAIFVESPVPDEVLLPYVVVNSVSDVPLDTLAEEGRQVTRDIACYARYTGSSLEITTITERVRELFHRQQITVSGYSNFITTVAGVNIAPTDRTVVGRIVSVRFSLEKNS